MYIKKAVQCIFYFDGNTGKVIKGHSLNSKKKKVKSTFQGKKPRDGIFVIYRIIYKLRGTNISKLIIMSLFNTYAYKKIVHRYKIQDKRFIAILHL